MDNLLELIDMLKKFRDLKVELEPKLEELKLLEKSIKDEILITGELIENEWVNVSFRKEYIKSSWDNKGLRGYAVIRPDVLNFLKETLVKSSVVIKFTKVK